MAKDLHFLVNALLFVFLFPFKIGITPMFDFIFLLDKSVEQASQYKYPGAARKKEYKA